MVDANLKSGMKLCPSELYGFAIFIAVHNCLQPCLELWEVPTLIFRTFSSLEVIYNQLLYDGSDLFHIHTV